jgi:hypothetical protein
MKILVMKNQTSVMSILLLLLTTLAISSCKKAEVKDILVGEWWIKGSQHYPYAFRKYAFDGAQYILYDNYAGKDSFDCVTIEITNHNSFSPYTVITDEEYRVTRKNGDFILEFHKWYPNALSGGSYYKWEELFKLVNVSDDEIILNQNGFTDTMRRCM